MKKPRTVFLAVLCTCLGLAVFVAATATRSAQGGSRPGHGPSVSPDVRQIVRDIRARNIEQTIDKLVGFGTRHTLSSQTDPNRGIGAATAWVFDQFQQIAATSEGRMTVEKQTFVQEPGPRVPEPTPITNVIATLRGTQPESVGRIYLVSGHLDSRCTDVLDATCDAPGADDDGSGVAAVLEMARVMATHEFDATIKFAVFSGEEQGLFGSTFFAEQAKQQGLNIAGMFSNDIIGSSLGQNGERDRRDVRLFAEGPPSNETADETALRNTMGSENDSPARQLARFVKEQAEPAVHNMNVWIIYRRDRFLRASDHVPFLDRRYPANRFTEPNEDFRHEHQNVRVESGVQFGDLPRFVDFEYVAQVARVNAAALAALADGPAAPQGVKVEASTLSVDTQLEWQPNPEPDLAGYEIVYRDTTEPLWSHRIKVGNVTSFTVKGITKDNFLFGVRAVDRHGNRSVVSFPVPK
ncbi:MAG TPA: M28 family metallopeptidase [Gaiellaceae bacterium]|jgi:acetylornithine deacetylase/succinyl-diaminopimelate desuccinylase-like protein